MRSIVALHYGACAARAPPQQVKPSGSKALVARVHEEADVIIWACGYASNRFPVRDASGAELKLRTSKGQVVVTLHYTTLHYTTLHYITRHYTTLHYITLHYITLYDTI